MKRYIVIILCLVALRALSSNPIPTDARVIDLGEAEAMALQNNPGYQSSRASYEAANWAKTSALSSFLPSLSLGGTWLYMDPATTVTTGAGSLTLNNDMRTISLSLSQPLFVGGKLWNAYKIAGLGKDIANTSLKNAELNLKTGVLAKYLDLLQLKQLYEIGRDDLNSALINQELAQIKLENGLITTADFLRFKSRVASKEVSLLQSTTALQIGLKDFANYLGAQEPVVPAPLADPEQDELLAALDAMQAPAVEVFVQKASALGTKSNPSLDILKQSLQISKRGASIAKGSFLPTVMLTGSRQYKENGIDRYEFSTADQIMLNVSIPLLPQIGNYAAWKKAEWEYRKALYDSQNAEQGIVLGIEAAVLNLVSSAKQVRAAKLTLEYTQVTYEQLQERFKLNMLSTLELLDAELMLSSTRMAYTNSLYSYYKNRGTLASLLGTADPQVLNNLIINAE